jgi:hypothetical protein
MHAAPAGDDVPIDFATAISQHAISSTAVRRLKPDEEVPMGLQAGPGSRWVLVALICCLTLAAGCGQSQGLSSGPSRGTVGTGGGYSFRLMDWPDELTLLLVDDIEGSHTAQSKAGGYGGTATARDGRGYSWQVSTRDGMTVHLEIDNRDYDCAQGALFVVRTKGGQTEIQQLARDLTHLAADGGDCLSYLNQDAEILKILGVEKSSR